jgi:leucyl-tRNA synthetase
MSKTLKNVVNPDEVIMREGADALRLYEMFMGPLADAKPWNTKDVPGVRNFLNRAWRLVIPKEEGVEIRPNLVEDTATDADLERVLHRTVHKVGGDIEKLAFNTAISAMMIFVNKATKAVDKLNRSQIERFLSILNPFAPHITEELWSKLQLEGSPFSATWPTVDESQLVDDAVEMMVQINGKNKGRITVATDAAEGDVETTAREEVASQLEGKTVIKAIVVKRLVNFVVR